MTYLELFDSAMRCTTKEQADAWMEVEVQALLDAATANSDTTLNEPAARESIKSTLGYMAGYGDDTVRDKVRDLFDALHPIFGDHRPTPEEAFAKGYGYGMRCWH